MVAVANEIDVFGEYYFNNCVTPLEATLTTAGTYYILKGVTKSQDYNITVNGTDGTMTALYDGLYKINGVATIFPSAGCLIRFTLFINDTAQDNICTALDFQNNQDTNTFSGSGFVRLVAGDVITVRATSDTNSITLDVTNINIALHRIGL